MRIEFNPEERELTLGFSNRGGVRSFFDRATTQGGFLVPLDDELGFRDTIAINVVSRDGLEFVFTADVNGVSRRTGGDFATTFLMNSWSLRESERLTAALCDVGGRLEGSKSPAGDGAPRQSSERELPQDEAPGATGEVRGTSPMHRLRSMNPNQRTALARKADRVERQILLNDKSPQVLQALLSNPRLEGKDVVRLVKSTHTSAPILKRIIEDGRWGQNQEVLGLVARNPKTPSPVAIRLVERVRTSDLRFMAKLSSGVRDSIRRAALREYMRRIGR